MRRLTALLGVAALLTILPATPALADGAIVAHDGICGGALPDENGELTDIFFLGTSNSRTTKSGITTVTCHFNLPPEVITSGNLKARGFPCYTRENSGGLTYDTRMNVSRGGRAVMTCRIKASRV